LVLRGGAVAGLALDVASIFLIRVRSMFTCVWENVDRITGLDVVVWLGKER
jgi:hypothetical protein